MSQVLGKYEIRREIGRGGFGRVYLGFDPDVGREVAIKVLTTEGDPSLPARFRTEASAAGNLHHRNIVTIHYFGEDRGMLFLVMEYLAGRDLYQIIANKTPLTLLEKMRIMTQVAEGLDCAHRSGIVHRDVKPGNIMVLPDGTVKIMDFGIARVTQSNATRLTRKGSVIGTFSCMAPEQLKGVEADILCDVWAYGIIYYQLLTGRHPFPVTDAAALMIGITSGDIQPPSELCSEVPEALDHVILRLLARDRENRYQSLEDVLFDTGPILHELEAAEVQRLIEEASVQLAQGQLQEARQGVKRILQLDPANAEGRQLLVHLQQQFKGTVRSRVQSLREKAEEEATKRDYVKAIAALQKALEIDPMNESLVARVETLKAAKERVDRFEKMLAEARAKLASGDFDAARAAAEKALEEEPESQDAKQLLEQIQEGRDAQSAKQVEEGVASAGEAATLPPASAMETAEGGSSQARAEAEIAAAQRIAEVKAAALAAMDAGNYNAAVDMLWALKGEFPGDASVAQLLAAGREEVRKRQKAAQIRSLAESAWKLHEAGDDDGAIAEIEKALVEYPEDSKLEKVRQAILAARKTVPEPVREPALETAAAPAPIEPPPDRSAASRPPPPIALAPAARTGEAPREAPPDARERAEARRRSAEAKSWRIPVLAGSVVALLFVVVLIWRFSGSSQEVPAATQEAPVSPEPAPVATNPLQADRTQLNFTLNAEGESQTETLSITSPGGPVEWVAATDAAWLSVEPRSGTTPATVTVTANPQGRDPDVYTGRVVMASQDRTSTLEIFVEMIVSAAPGAK